MDKPIIGVLPLVDEERESYWMLPGYFEGVIEAGGIPIMLPLIYDEKDLNRLVNEFNGFIFTGGPDIDPKYYNAAVETDNVKTCEPRDKMEILFARKAIESGKPILGICRGLQLINVALGGTLYQDLPSQRKSDLNHSQEKPYDKPIHDVVLDKTGGLYELLSRDSLGVNSCHHQGIKELAPGLSSMAVATDGLVEAFEMKERNFLWGLQWHPEFMQKVSQPSRDIFKKFINSCK